MKREEKNIMARQKILDAALHEFSTRGYEGASLNNACTEFNVSKGIIYHYFKDKDEIYLQCVKMCFESLTQYLLEQSKGWKQDLMIYEYFDKRMEFFTKYPNYYGIFVGLLIQPPKNLVERIDEIREPFDEFTHQIITQAFNRKPLRKNHSVETVSDDFRFYFDYFNLRFQIDPERKITDGEVLKQKERFHRQLDILLYGVWEGQNEEE
ncbi:MAG: TetR/AcrR family transcriptional regulator [Erysipelotrichaceae bacterium]|nr:TetR/AcrR family transcriptional regulator [Erysipelotrichaceae bacterium]